MRIRILTLLLPAIMVLAACQDYVVTGQDYGDPTKVDAAIQVEPTVLDFQQLNAGVELTLPVTIHSVGEDTLFLSDLFIDGPISFSLDDAGTERILAPGSSTQLPVTYAPMSDEVASGLLHILSNDRATPDATVDLLATGLAPMIELDPATWDFGDHEVGCEQEQAITIRNVGSAPLVLEELVFAPTSTELQMSYYFQPGTTLGPNQEQIATVYYVPTDELPDTGYLHVYSNDPAHPDALATQFGTAHLAGEVIDEFEQEGNNWTDILWVVDNSCSMGDEQTSLAINFAAFLDIVDVLDIDYHISVVTTDNGNFQGGLPIMSPAAPDVHAAFADAVSVGTGGSATEQGLKYGMDALTAPLAAPGGPNDGFLRPEAGLRVIFVSDEPDQSPDTVINYVTQFQNMKVNPDHVILSCIVSQPSLRYEQAAQMTGGLTESIDNPNWVNTLSQLAWLSLSWAGLCRLVLRRGDQRRGLRARLHPGHRRPDHDQLQPAGDLRGLTDRRPHGITTSNPSITIEIGWSPSGSTCTTPEISTGPAMTSTVRPPVSTWIRSRLVGAR